MKTLRLICIFCLILGLCSLAIAEETKRIATFAEIEGSVEVRAYRGKWVPAKAGMVLNAGDTIRTQRKSLALLNLNGKAQTATVQVKENSQLTLSELVEDQKKETQKTLLDLALGQILIKAQKFCPILLYYSKKKGASFWEGIYLNKSKKALGVNILMPSCFFSTRRSLSPVTI